MAGLAGLADTGFNQNGDSVLEIAIRFALSGPNLFLCFSFSALAMAEVAGPEAAAFRRWWQRRR